jgi:hypothetical protein
MSNSETLSYRQIQMGNLTIGMVGLKELFETLRNRNVPPAEAAIADLLQGARRHNYIPPAADEKMGVVLLREYRQFCARPVTVPGVVTPGRRFPGSPPSTPSSAMGVAPACASAPSGCMPRPMTGRFRW